MHPLKQILKASILMRQNIQQQTRTAMYQTNAAVRQQLKAPRTQTFLKQI